VNVPKAHPFSACPQRAKETLSADPLIVRDDPLLNSPVPART
jgi:hypothetical protein